MRIGIAVGVLIALGTPTSVFGQDTPPFQRLPDDVGFMLSGSTRLSYLSRGSQIESARSTLDSTPPTPNSMFVMGYMSLRLDIQLPERGRAVIELANQPYVNGVDLPLDTNSGPDIVLRQVRVDLPEILTKDLSIRFGAFDYAWKCRPHDEPFFLDVAHSESFFSSAGAQTADRDVSQPAGVLLQYHVGDFVEIEAVGMTVREGGSTANDESLVGLYINFPAPPGFLFFSPERTAFFLAAALVTGPGKLEARTLGLGLDTYFGLEREIEVFLEAYSQTGSGTAKAWGGQSGVRWWTRETWIEGAIEVRSRNFLSYENRNRFHIVETAEEGLDWDTDLVTLRGTISHDLAPDLTARLDAGSFHLPHGVAGEKALGTEIDATLTLRQSKAVEFWIAGAMLAGSDVLEVLTPDGDRNAWLFTTGARLVW